MLAQNLKSDNANINISGVGTVTTATQDTLTTAITGTGSIYYKGTPKHINREISGVGKIEPLTEYQEKEFNKNDSYKPNKAGTYWAVSILVSMVFTTANHTLTLLMVMIFWK